MDHDSKNNAGALVMFAVIVLLLIGGAGVYVFLGRQQAAAARRETVAARAESEARLATERALAIATAKVEAAERAAANQRESDSNAGGDAARTDLELIPADVKSLRADVEAVLRAQEAAWNQGDLDAFAEHYWKSDDLSFSSGGKTTRGWADTVRGYKQRYATPEAMGRLTLSDFEITPLGDEAAFVLGAWKVARENEPLNGNFSLVLRKIDGRWVIVHDHTSRRVE